MTTLRCDTHPEFELRTIRVEKVGHMGTSTENGANVILFTIVCRDVLHY